MRASASSTERGFTLIEVALAATLLAVVMGVVLQQFSDTTKLNKVLIARADMRRIGQNVLTNLVNDVRSTNAVNCSANGTTLEFYKVVGFDTTNAVAITENPKLCRYSQSTSVSTNLNFYYRTQAQGAIPGSPDNPTAVLVTELDPSPPPQNGASGFCVQVAPGPFPASLLSAGGAIAPGTNVFADAPQVLTITLNMKRQVGGALPGGISTDTGGILNAIVTLQTQVELRPSQNY